MIRDYARDDSVEPDTFLALPSEVLLDIASELAPLELIAFEKTYLQSTTPNELWQKVCFFSWSGFFLPENIHN